MSGLDPRRNAYRPDLADARLRGKVEAARFVDGKRHRVRIPMLPVAARPGADFPMTTQALMGEDVLVFDVAIDWAFVQLVRDGYTGNVHRAALTDELPQITHRVTALCALTFKQADIKSELGWYIPLGARLHGTRRGEFLWVADSGYVPIQQIAAIGQLASDFVAVAERLIGAPYLWGGKTPVGIDCSGLVQVAMQAAGHDAPRDSDMQAAELGDLLAPAEWSRLQRGDLVFWRGHAGIMTDGERLLHANAHHMAVTLEPLAEVIARAEANSSPVTAIRRLEKLSTAVD